MQIAGTMRRALTILRDSGGSQIAEFAVCVPLLTVFAVGIFDFSGAFNLKQKLGSAAQEGALVAASQPTFDLVANQTVPPPPPSVQSIERAVFLDLANQNVLPNAAPVNADCGTAPVPVPVGPFAWQYPINGCPGLLIITIDRGCTPGSPSPCPINGAGEDVIYSHVTVSYPYALQFNNVIQLVGGSSASSLTITADAFAANQS